MKVPRGALLNAAAVLVGSALGLTIGSVLAPSLKTLAMSGMGLVTVGLGVKMFVPSKNPILAAAALVMGGVIGSALGIHHGLDWIADQMRRGLGGGERFNEGLVTATVLFCIGPMTLLGCIEDGMRNKLDLLGVKSLLDGTAALFLSAGSLAFGQGVLCSTLAVLLIQGTMTLAARPLSKVAERPGVIEEITAVGGLILLAIGLGLLGVVEIRSENFLPALLLAPLFELVSARWSQRPGKPEA